MTPYHYYQLFPCKNHAIGVVFCMLAPGGSNRSKRKTTSCTPQWVCPHKCRHQFRKLPSAHLLHRYRFSVPASVSQISHCEAIYRFPRRGKYHGCFFLVALKRNKPIFKKRQHSLRQTHLRLFYCLRQQHPKPNLVEQGNLSAQYWNLSLEACFFVRYTKNKSFKPQSFEQIEETSPFLIGKPHLGNIHRKDETRYGY